MVDDMADDMLTVEDVTVSFGGVKALDDLSFSVRSGEIHGIIGPNGAGKTTSINVLTGFVPRRGGRVLFQGKELPRAPHRIAALGIGRTFQAPATFPALTAVENVMSGGDRHLSAGIVGGMLRTKKARLEQAQSRREAETLLERVGFALPPDTPVSGLPYGEHRKLEIARALMFRPRLLLLDEPTAGLTSDEVDIVADLLRRVVDEATDPLSIVLVEHNVPLVFSLSDTVTAFHEGRVIASGTPAVVRHTHAVIESYLGGHDPEVEPEPVVVSEPTRREGTRTRRAESALKVNRLEAGYGRIKVLKGVDLTVEPGELVLVYGRNGAGKSTLLNSIVGNPRPSGGEVLLGSQPLHHLSVSQIVRAGVALVPQERGVIAGLSVEDNLRLGTVGLGLRRGEYQNRREELLDRFPALRSRTRQLAGTLSGGERQMLALAKVLVRHPAALLLDEPSIGLAPTVVEQLQGIVRQISAEGISVLVAEQNVWWVAPLASRAYLLETGTVAHEGSADEVIKRESLITSYLGGEIEDPAPGSSPDLSRH